MSDATEAWEEWIEKNRGRPEIWSTASTDSFAAGFAAGQVSALEDAAKELATLVPYGYGMNPDGTEDRTAMAYVEGHREAWQAVTNRAAELSKEQHDQPDA